MSMDNYLIRCLLKHGSSCLPLWALRQVYHQGHYIRCYLGGLHPRVKVARPSDFKQEKKIQPCNVTMTSVVRSPPISNVRSQHHHPRKQWLPTTWPGLWDTDIALSCLRLLSAADLGHHCAIAVVRASCGTTGVPFTPSQFASISIKCKWRRPNNHKP